MRKTRRATRLSMTSLIDVIFLLLLFFMLSSTFSKFAEVELTAAGSSARASDVAQEPPLFLRLMPDAISLNGHDLTLDTLAATLSEKADADTPRPVLVAMSGEVTSQRLTDVLMALRSVAGIAPTILGGRS